MKKKIFHSAEKTFFFSAEILIFLRMKRDVWEPNGIKNVLKTPIFLLIDGEWDTKNECHFVGRTCRRLTHGSTSCGRNLPGRTDCRCAEAKGMQCVLRPARENRAGFAAPGFGAEIRESRVRLWWGTKRW